MFSKRFTIDQLILKLKLEDPTSLCHSRIGVVTPLICQGTTTGAIYGDGTYFARDSSYSLDYALPLASGQKQMLVAEVRSGN